MKAAILVDMNSHIPIRVWGDDAPVGKHGRAIKTISWASAATRAVESFQHNWIQLSCLSRWNLNSFMLLPGRSTLWRVGYILVPALMGKLCPDSERIYNGNLYRSTEIEASIFDSLATGHFSTRSIIFRVTKAQTTYAGAAGQTIAKEL